MVDSKQHSFQIVVCKDFQKVNQCILDQLHSDVTLINKIGEYIIKSGGKRLRPLLVLLTANACGYSSNNHIPLAAIIEFLHTATLLHDDVVDKSELRRGRNTANSVWGNSPCILVGDFLYSRAFQLMVGIENFRLLNTLADATNIIAEGEVMQMMGIHNATISEATYMKIIRCKTAMLFSASTQTASILSGASSETEKSLTHYGNYLGMAFQLIDDVLDYSGNSKVMGKNLGDDLAEGKPTLPLIYTMAHGTLEQKSLVRKAMLKGDLTNIHDTIQAVRSCGALEYTIQKAQEFTDKAVASLKNLPTNKYYEAMKDLAKYAIDRTQ